MSQSSQKFIGRNRTPRVQIEYEVDTITGIEKKELPFVMGVMADLSGKPSEALATLGERKFLEIDSENFDDRLKAARPRVSFQVPNTLTGEGNLSIDISFEKMDDFSPEAIAAKVDSLNKLFTARKQLAELLSYMDGKSKAEDKIASILESKDLRNLLASKPASSDAHA